MSNYEAYRKIAKDHWTKWKTCHCLTFVPYKTEWFSKAYIRTQWLFIQPDKSHKAPPEIGHLSRSPRIASVQWHRPYQFFTFAKCFPMYLCLKKGMALFAMFIHRHYFTVVFRQLSFKVDGCIHAVKVVFSHSQMWCHWCIPSCLSFIFIFIKP